MKGLYMLKMTWQILFLGSPLFIAALAHGLCMKYNLLQWLKRPIDSGKKFRNKRIFGDNKTWRAPFIYIIICLLGTMLQARIQAENLLPEWLFFIDYQLHGCLVGVLLGIGMTVGELPNSFIKRQLDIAPGKKKRGLLGFVFFLYDQVDLAIGIWIFLSFVIRPSLLLIGWSLVLTLFLHIAISGTGYLLGMRETMV